MAAEPPKYAAAACALLEEPVSGFRYLTWEVTMRASAAMIRPTAPDCIDLRASAILGWYRFWNMIAAVTPFAAAFSATLRRSAA